MRRQASNGAKNQSASSGGGEGRGGDGDADFERCVEKGVPKSAEEKKDAVYYKEKYAKAKKRNQKLEKDVERLLEREETAAAYLSQHTEAHDVGEDDGVWDEYEQGEEESDEEELNLEGRGRGG